MSESPGVTVMTEFCTWADAAFSGYVNYLDREEAERQKPVQEGSLFSEYLDYQGKGIFTRDSDALTEEEKGQIKQMFQLAQSRHSLMWQTVISFDTDWLIEQGIYHKESGRLNEAALKSATRKGIQKMLDAEGLSHALWTAAIRYNPEQAEARYREHLKNKGPGLKIGKDIELANYIEKEILEKRYSPYAVLRKIKNEGLKFETEIRSVNTIYSYIRKGIFLNLSMDHRIVKKK